MPPEADLLRSGMLPALPAALLSGRESDLLAPLTLWRGDTIATDPPIVDRRRLAAGLARANGAYGHPQAAALGDKFADPATRIVVTGQQPGVLGGPLYTLTKAVAAVRVAERLEGDGRPAMAVFWVHTEDHDFAEISRSVVMAPAGPLELSLGDDASPLQPVGLRRLGSGISDLLTELGAAMPGDEYQTWIETLGDWYRPEARIGEAFCGLMTGLLGDRCPMLLDAMLPEVKEAQAPALERLVERRRELAVELDSRTRKVSERGYRPQVRFEPESAPFFLLHDELRRRVIWEQDGYRLRGGADRAIGTIEKLIAMARLEPARLSPGVLARPAVQDAILGTSVQVIGPGELAYMTQAAGVHEILGVAPPQVALRPQVLTMTARQVSWLEASGVMLEELVATDDRLDQALARELGGDFVAPARQRFEEMLEDLDAAAKRLDPNLGRPSEKTRQQVLRALDNFSNRVAGALANRDQIQRRRLRELREVCRPLGELQERVISSAHFPGLFGAGFLAALWELDLEPDRLQVIVPQAIAGSTASRSASEGTEAGSDSATGE